jgi:ABC-type antimicrobial peptide transport system permease subunit
MISLILATAGLFSVLTYVVGQRMRELAIRMALGARRVDILRLVLIGSAEMAVGGALGGAVLGMWGASTLRAYLYGIEPTDPVALVAAEGVLAAAVLLASLPAAIRAMRADPAEVLRAI